MDPYSGLGPVVTFDDFAMVPEVFGETPPTDPSTLCITLIDSLEFENDPIALFFTEECGVKTAQDLKANFSEDDLKNINSLLRWHLLLQLGYIVDMRASVDDFYNVQKFLGINNCIEIVYSSSTMSESPDNPQSFANVLELIKNRSQCPEAGLYPRFCKILGKDLSNKITATEIMGNIEFALDLPGMSHLFEPLSVMDDSTRFRLALFVSITSFYVGDYATANYISDQARNPTRDISEDMRPVLVQLCESLEKKYAPAFKVPCDFGAKNGSLRSCKRVSFLAERVESFTKMDIEGLPNWMPNNNDTCYISSTIWSLFVLLHDKIEEKIKGFNDLEPFATTAETDARNAFKTLYSLVAERAVRTIPVELVNDFRTKLLVAFPYRFDQRTTTQDDAHIFLACTLLELLGLDSTKVNDPRFLVFHTYKTELHQDHSHVEEPSYILDIRIDDTTKPKVSFKELITSPRDTGEVERNNGISKHTEQLLVSSEESAPEFLCASLTRFFFDYGNRTSKKRDTLIYPNASLEFHIQGQEDSQEVVPYDLAAITVHSAETIHAGHYYTYLRKCVQDSWKFYRYDDKRRPQECLNEQEVFQDAAKNGSIFYYKKRKKEDVTPPEFAIYDTKEWVTNHLFGKFQLHEENSLNILLLNDPARLKSVFDRLSARSEQPVYLIDLKEDNDLVIIEGYPFPSDNFRFGEEFAGKDIMYMLRQKDGSFIMLKKTPE